MDTTDRPGSWSDPLTPVGFSVDLEELAARVATLVLERLGDRSTDVSPWLDVDRAAVYLSCSPERIRKLVQRQAVPFHQERAGGRIFLHRRELDEWLVAQ